MPALSLCVKSHIAIRMPAKISPWDEMTEKEKKERKEKEKVQNKKKERQEKAKKEKDEEKEDVKEEEQEEEKDKKETLAIAFGERMLGSMSSHEVGVAPAAPATPRLSACRRADCGIICPFLG